MSSATPRTDAIVAAYNTPPYCVGLIDVTEHARQLERELSAAKAERDEASECLREMLTHFQYAKTAEEREEQTRWRRAAGLEDK